MKVLEELQKHINDAEDQYREASDAQCKVRQEATFKFGTEGHVIEVTGKGMRITQKNKCYHHREHIVTFSNESAHELLSTLKQVLGEDDLSGK